MWRELVSSLFADAAFAPPSTLDELVEAERELGVALPDMLRQLFLETNGVKAYYSSPFVWPIAELVAENQILRDDADFAELYMPFDCLLFFGGRGDGDLFGYRILAGRVRDPFIYEWGHEFDERTWFAANLEDYFRRCVPKETA
jgi:hypothetical protein